MKEIFFCLLFLFVSVCFSCNNVGFSTDCSNHGICAFDQRINATRCVCDVGYTGPTCMNGLTTESSTTLATVPVTVTPSTMAVTTQPVTNASTVTSVASSVASTAVNTLAPTVGPTSLFTATLFTTTLQNNCINFRSTEYPKKICSGHGTCEEGYGIAGYCMCQEKFVGEYCETEQKTKGVAALLEFFLGSYGAGDFYLGYIGLGVVKILLGVIGCCGVCISICIFFGSNGESKGTGAAVCVQIVVGLLCTIVSIWVFVDFIRILVGAKPDANGVALYNGFKRSLQDSMKDPL